MFRKLLNSYEKVHLVRGQRWKPTEVKARRLFTFGLVERAISHFDHFKYGAFARRYRLEKDESVANSSFETTSIADNSVLADAAGMRDSRRDRSDR